MKKIILLIGTACLTCLITPQIIPKAQKSWSIPHFSSLDRLEKYAAKLPEFPLNDMPDWTKVSFSSLYQRRQYQYTDSLKQLFGLDSAYWKPKQLRKILESIISEQEKRGFSGNIATVINPPDNSQFIIISDLQSAFHPLIRYLRYLQIMDFIDEGLYIKKKNTFIVFNGNACIGFAYGVDTLRLIAQLMLNNPHQVFYIRGTEENKGLWRQEAIAEELKIRLGLLSNDRKEYLNQLVEHFFNTTPISLYVIAQKKAESIEVVRISSIDPSTKEYFENNIVNAEDKEISVISIDNDQIKPLTKKLIIKAWIKGAQKNSSAGLTMLKGTIPTWVTLSGPVGKFRAINHFKDDSFIILKTSFNLTNWTINLYTTHNEENISMGLNKILNIFTGEETFSQEPQNYKATALIRKKEILEHNLTALKKELATLEQPDTKSHITQGKEIIPSPEENRIAEVINIGSTMDLSRSEIAIGETVQKVLESYFDMVNKKNILAPRSIKLSIMDDEYNAAIAQKKIHKLIQDYKVHILLCPVGSHTIKSYIDKIEKGDITVLFPIAETPLFSTGKFKHIVNFGASSFETGQAITDYILKTFKPTKIAACYQTSANQIEGGIIAATNKANFNNLTLIPFDYTGFNLKEPVDTIKKENPQAIIIATGTFAALTLARLLNANYFEDHHLASAISFLNTSNIKTYMNKNQIKFICPSLVPDPAKADLEIVRDFLNFAQQYSLSIEPLSLQVYISARIFTEIIKKIDGPVTQEKIIETAQGFTNYDLAGIPLNFDPLTRRLITNFWIDTATDEWVTVPLKQTARTQLSSQQDLKEAKLKSQADQALQTPRADLAAKQQVQLDKPPIRRTEQITLKIGSTMDLKRANKQAGITVSKMIDFIFEKFNRSKETNKIALEWTVYSDDYAPQKARQNIETLISDGVNIILAPSGSDAFQAYVDYIQSGSILALFPDPGTPDRSIAKLRHCIYLTPSYAVEIEALIGYILKKAPPHKILIVYQNDQYGKTCLQAAEKKLLAAGMKYDSISYERNDIELKEQITKIQTSGADTVGLFVVPSVGKRIFESLTMPSDKTIQYFGPPDLLNAIVIQQIKSGNFKCFISSGIPNPNSKNLKILQDYHQVLQEAQLPKDNESLYAYLSANIFIEAIQQTQGPINQETIINAFENFKDYDLKGLKLNFDPLNRQLLHTVWINSGKEEWEPIEIEDSIAESSSGTTTTTTPTPH